MILGWELIFKKWALMPTVLVVEDSESNAQLVRVALETKGYSVKIAVNGQAGLDAVHKIQPDLMVIDLRLPVEYIDGWELIRTLKSDPDCRDIPIVVTSVEITPEDRNRALDAGCDRYFSKPFSVKELRAEIDLLINSRK
jgi:CheY-like chemotaxis protein